MQDRKARKELNSITRKRGPKYAIGPGPRYNSAARRFWPFLAKNPIFKKTPGAHFGPSRGRCVGRPTIPTYPASKRPGWPGPYLPTHSFSVRSVILSTQPRQRDITQHAAAAGLRPTRRLRNRSTNGRRVRARPAVAERIGARNGTGGAVLREIMRLDTHFWARRVWVDFRKVS